MEISVQSESDYSKNEEDVIVGATLLFTATGDHPIKKVRNFDWEDYTSNRSARFQGFPKLVTLLKLKQDNVNSVESNDSGSGPDGRGWAVRWRLFPEKWDPEQKFTLADLAYCLDQFQPEVSRKDYNQILSPGYIADDQPESLSAAVTSRSAGRSLDAAGADSSKHAALTPSTMTNSILFDVVLISRLPPGIKTQALRHLPLSELTAKPSFCFLWVEDFAEIELCCGILEGWGFRPAEDILIYNESVFGAGVGIRENRRGKASESWQGTIGFSGGCKWSFGDLSGAEALSDLGLDQEDYNSMIPHELHKALKSDSESSDPSAFHQQTQYCESEKVAFSVPIPEIFARGTHHCLMGIKGTIKRSSDGHIIHCNVDTDILLSKGSAGGPTELIDLVENFTLGRRRLHLFGDDTSRRRGWVTMGPDISKTNLDIQAWLDGMHGGHLIKATQAIESLRPKSPPDSSSGSTGWVPPTSVIFESLLSPHSAVSSLERDVSSPRSQDPAFQDSLLNACLQGIGGAPRQRQIAPVAGSQASRYGHMSAPFPFSGVSSQLKEHPFVHAVSELRHGLQNQCNDNISPRQAQFVHRNSHARPKQSVLAMKSPTPDLSHTSAQNYEHHPPLPLCVGRGFPALQPDYHDGLQLVQWTCQRRFHYTHGASWQGPSHKGGIPLSFTEPRPKGFSQEPQLGDVPRIFETAYKRLTGVFANAFWHIHLFSFGPLEDPPWTETPSSAQSDEQVANCGRAAQVAGEGPSQFEALTARALQEAVAMPIYPPPPEWKPGNHLHPFYYEIAMSFQDCFGKILEARGVFNPTSFLEEWLDHVRQIFSGFEKQWEARDSGSTIGIGIASKWENAPIAAHALVQVLDLPTSPPLAGWKPGDLLHPYYGSLLNRFDDALRTMLADTHHPLCSDEKALTWVINVQACKIMQEIRDVWMANFAL